MDICFKVLAIVNAAANLRVQRSFGDCDLISFRCIPRSEVVGSYGSSIFNSSEECSHCFLQ